MKDRNIFWKYILKHRIYLLVIGVTGIIYNVGLTMGPYFEGQLVQRFVDISEGRKLPITMISLALVYLFVILIVQGDRCLKRYYVRKFGNDINKDLKTDIYRYFVCAKEVHDDQGSVMTKAIMDVDACSEGIRKFTTEVFDTGIALLSYLGMLMIYDVKLTIIASSFQILAYLICNDRCQ